MGDKFKDKYRIESTRLQNWDYGWRGKYYVTICTRGRECFFGEIINKQMVLSEIGKIVNAEWLKTLAIRPDMNLTLDEYVIMPNHIHGIIRIGKNEYNKFDNNNILGSDSGRDAMHGVSTTGTSNQNEELLQRRKNKQDPQRKNLSSIIRGFKASVTTEARKIHADFVWQSRFDDRIIRDEKSLNRIREYIKDNPKKWKDDELNPDNNIDGYE